MQNTGVVGSRQAAPQTSKRKLGSKQEAAEKALHAAVVISQRFSRACVESEISRKWYIYLEKLHAINGAKLERICSLELTRPQR